jgi:hypothetical protein
VIVRFAAFSIPVLNAASFSLIPFSELRRFAPYVRNVDPVGSTKIVIECYRMEGTGLDACRHSHCKGRRVEVIWGWEKGLGMTSKLQACNFTAPLRNKGNCPYVSCFALAELSLRPLSMFLSHQDLVLENAAHVSLQPEMKSLLTSSLLHPHYYFRFRALSAINCVLNMKQCPS